MSLLTPDGRPYKTFGSLQVYQPDAENPQIKLFNLWDEDTIRSFGSPLYYYEVFISPGEIDTTYIEARGKIYSNHPVEIWAVYEPLPSQNYQNQWGIESLNEMVFECNAQAVIKAIGHMPKIGSRIYSPHLGENWKVVQRNLGEFKMWSALRVQLIAQQFQESATTSGGRVTESKPDIPKSI
ncbi:MAG: hypothetical protein DWQ19_11680 [Crenarchaeota archaeon]|nr:MAG: hypothetical protein DWQ19_11680 [Thermoproteota archaeon]